MINKRYWPFDIPSGYELTAEDKRDFSFLEAASGEGHKAFQLEGIVLGAAATNGREGEIVRRGGRGRYWEIILSDGCKRIRSAYIDGFGPASTAVLAWLRGEECSVVIRQIEHAIVNKPGERGWQ
jgi:hypothetical protein